MIELPDTSGGGLLGERRVNRPGANVSRGWLKIARLANAQWFAVSLFEDVIELPDRLAREPGRGAFAPGSPARYHVPMSPLVLGSAALAACRARSGPARRWAVAGAVSTGASAALTGFLIGTVNVPLLEDRADPEQRPRLVARWHRVNKARLVLLVCAGIAFHRTAQAEESTRVAATREAAGQP